MINDDEWWWMIMNDDRWWWIMMDNDGWWWMIMNDDSFETYLNIYEYRKRQLRMWNMSTRHVSRHRCFETPLQQSPWSLLILLMWLIRSTGPRFETGFWLCLIVSGGRGLLRHLHIPISVSCCFFLLLLLIVVYVDIAVIVY